MRIFGIRTVKLKLAIAKIKPATAISLSRIDKVKAVAGIVLFKISNVEVVAAII